MQNIEAAIQKPRWNDFIRHLWNKRYKDKKLSLQM